MEFCRSLHLISKEVFIFKIKKFYPFLNMIKFTAIVFMRLRYFALGYPLTLKFVKKTLVFLLWLTLCPLFSQNSMDDVENQADKAFKKEDYTAAYKLYSQLVSNFPKDPEFNYR